MNKQVGRYILNHEAGVCGSLRILPFAFVLLIVATLSIIIAVETAHAQECGDWNDVSDIGQRIECADGTIKLITDNASHAIAERRLTVEPGTEVCSTFVVGGDTTFARFRAGSTSKSEDVFAAGRNYPDGTWTPGPKAFCFTAPTSELFVWFSNGQAEAEISELIITYTPSTKLIISDLAANSDNDYRLESGLAVGSPVYTDRSYAVTSVAKEIAGSSYIVTPNDDKGLADETLISFEVDGPIRVFVAYDMRATSLPDWLRDWTDIALNFETSDIGRSLHYKDFDAGKIVLGANSAAGSVNAQSNFNVIIVKSPVIVDPGEPDAPPVPDDPPVVGPKFDSSVRDPAIRVVFYNPACLGQPPTRFEIDIPAENAIFAEPGDGFVSVYFRDGDQYRRIARTPEHVVIMHFIPDDGGRGSRILVDGKVVKVFGPVAFPDAWAETKSIGRGLGIIGGGIEANPGGTVFLGLTDRYGSMNDYPTAEAFTTWLMNNGSFPIDVVELADILGVSVNEIGKFNLASLGESHSGLVSGQFVDIKEALATGHLSGIPDIGPEGRQTTLTAAEADALGLVPCGGPTPPEILVPPDDDPEDIVPDPPLKEPMKISAAISGHSLGTVVTAELGEPINLSASVINDGNANWDFWTALTLRRPDGSVQNLPMQEVSLVPGETGHADWIYTPDQAGVYDVVFGIWFDLHQTAPIGHSGWINDQVIVTELADTSLESYIRAFERIHYAQTFPPYLLNVDTLQNSINTTWLGMTNWATGQDLISSYDQAYRAGQIYDSLSFSAIRNAREHWEAGEFDLAEDQLNRAKLYHKLSVASFMMATETFIGNVDSASILAKGIVEGSRTSVSFGLQFTGPLGAAAGDLIDQSVGFAMTASEEGWDEAEKDLIRNTFVSVLLNKIPFEQFGGKTLSQHVENRVGKEVFPLLQKAFTNEEAQFAGSKVIKALADEGFTSLTQTQVNGIFELFMQNLNAHSMR